MEGRTLGNFTAMETYAIAVLPVIFMLMEISLQENCNAFAAACADDLTTVGSIDQLKKW